MKRTSLALLFSLMVHLCVIVAFLIWEDKPVSITSERIALHISTVGVTSKVPVVEEVIPIEQPQKKLTTEPIVRASNEAKPLPRKQEKHTPKTQMAPLTQDVAMVQENNESSFLPQTDTRVSLKQESVKQSYLELHGNEIRALIEKHKEYPELARRRSLSDTVEVSFTLTTEGEIEDIGAASRFTILSKSAIETLHRAKPLFPKPTENVTIKIPIVYILK